MIRTDGTGTEVWRRLIGGPQRDDAHSVVEIGTGGIRGVGETESFGAEFTDVLMVHLNSDGTPEE